MDSIVNAPAPVCGVSDREMANAIRALAMDAVENAGSGHPGMPLGMADVATVLFTRVLKFDPTASAWPDRDRLVLSAGHGSMLLYALLYLTGYEGFTIEDLKRFRRLGSKTAGHPEYGICPGVETTTGPLGQGLANAVGMALAERMLAARFGRTLVDHFTYVIAGDGCLMEGLSHEAVAFAGHQRLGRLILLFDDNRISIDGPTPLATSDDHLARFAASRWHVQAVDGHDPAAIENAIRAAQADERPSLIACRTIIGFGAPTKQGRAEVHGSPLGAAGVEAARAALGWTYKPFFIPREVLSAWRMAGRRGSELRLAWERRQAAAPAALRKAWRDVTDGAALADIDETIEEIKFGFVAKGTPIATRQASRIVLERLVPELPSLLGGSADLSESNGTKTTKHRNVSADDGGGNYIHYGVREHGMAAIMNGIALHGGFVPYGGTFLVFSDYARPAIRLAALMRLRVIFVMTHDSIGLGEDGPTHQPVEHLASLRAIPNLLVFRPADAVETAEAWECALRAAHRPSVLCLTRQSVPILRRAADDLNLVAFGAYVVTEPEGGRDVTLLATGSEVSIACVAARRLAKEGIRAAVVSMPCWELFAEQDNEYRASVLGDAPRVALEAALDTDWRRWLGWCGAFVGMSDFGASGPADELYVHFGITPDNAANAARHVLGRLGQPA
jgi:transketolase